jgi:CheY-like chemotaxis protein
MSRGIAAPVSRRVLLVEDNPDGRETLRLLLELYGHIVEEAADGREGVEKALAWQPEVAVVDIGLPLLDGFEVARRLRAALGGHVLLIALTAYGQPEDIRLAFRAGFDHHLTKPADVGELLRLLQPGSPAWVCTSRGDAHGT